MSKIISVQNGFLLSEHVHSLFDQYLISVNPDASDLFRRDLLLMLIV